MNELVSREASRIRRFCMAGIMTGMVAAVTISMIVITISSSSSVTPRECDGRSSDVAAGCASAHRAVIMWL